MLLGVFLVLDLLLATFITRADLRFGDGTPGSRVVAWSSAYALGVGPSMDYVAYAMCGAADIRAWTSGPGHSVMVA